MQSERWTAKLKLVLLVCYNFILWLIVWLSIRSNTWNTCSFVKCRQNEQSKSFEWLFTTYNRNQVTGSKGQFIVLFFSFLTTETIAPTSRFHEKQAERWNTAAKGEGGSAWQNYETSGSSRAAFKKQMVTRLFHKPEPHPPPTQKRKKNNWTSSCLASHCPSFYNSLIL